MFHLHTSHSPNPLQFLKASCLLVLKPLPGNLFPNTYSITCICVSSRSLPVSPLLLVSTSGFKTPSCSQQALLALNPSLAIFLVLSATRIGIESKTTCPLTQCHTWPVTVSDHCRLSIFEWDSLSS